MTRQEFRSKVLGMALGSPKADDTLGDLALELFDRVDALENELYDLKRKIDSLESTIKEMKHES